MKNGQAHRWIFQAAKKDGWVIGLLSATSGVIAFGYVWFALISQKVIDTATGTIAGNMWQQSCGLLGVLLLQAALNIIQSRLRVRATGRMSMRMKQTLITGLYQKQWQSVSAYHTGDILNRLTSDVTVVSEGTISLIPQCVALATRLMVCIVVLFMTDAAFTLILLAAGLGFLLFSRMYGRRMKALHRDCQESDGRVRSFMQECLEGFLVIQSFGASGSIGERLQKLQDTFFHNQLRRNRISNLANTAVYLLFSGCYYAAVAWGAWRLSTGVLTFGMLTAFLQIIHQVQVPFRSMSGLVPQYFGMVASAERLMEIERLPAEERSGALPQGEALAQCLRRIEARHIRFGYTQEKPVLSDVSFAVDKGEFIAFAGDSGIGKSTLFKLLLGFLKPQSGQMTLLTGEGAFPLDAGARSLFAYVPQGNPMLSGTIRENLTFFCEGYDENAIWDALARAQMQEFVSGLPNGLDTVLGERGLGLSEGQVQRLSIARGLLSRAPVLLLDEATSALDAQTEEAVLRNLRAVEGLTCLLISHRPAALSVCDRVIRIENGCV